MVFIVSILINIIFPVFMISENNNLPEGKAGNEEAPKEAKVEVPASLNNVNDVARLNNAMFATLAKVAAMGRTSLDNERIAQSSLDKRVIDLPKVPLMVTAKMNLTQNGALLLSLNNGKQLFNHPMNIQERTAMSQILDDKNLNDDQKLGKITNLVSSIALSTQLQANFKEGMDLGMSQSNNMHR